ncbi:MAG: alpha/beta family hydrolase [Actinomycetota bacterium]
MSEVRGTIDAGPAEVSTARIAPSGAIATLVLAHGAGVGMDHPFLEGFCWAMAEHEVATLRFNFPYVERGRRSPDPEAMLRATWLAAFAAGRRVSQGGLVFAGGKSLGGRVASMVVADGMPAAGLVFLGYPFHPPGRPERIRDEHLYRVDVPMLFLQGSADPFADPVVFQPVLAKLGDRAVHVEIEGGDHSFKVRGARTGDRDVGAQLAEHAASFIHWVAGVA